MNSLPNEILLSIFKYLPLRKLMALRRVCSRWKTIIESLSDTERKWALYCIKEYKNTAQNAKYKSPQMRWTDIYRSLSLWRMIKTANETIDVFGKAAQEIMEIRNFTIDNEGVMTVLRNNVVDYYDINNFSSAIGHTQILIRVSSIHYECNNYGLVLLDRTHKLHVKLFAHHLQAIFDDVQGFTLVGDKVYYYKPHGKLYLCEVINGKLKQMPICFWDSENVLRISYTDRLNILVSDGNIFSYNGRLKHRCTIHRNTICNLITYDMLNGKDEKDLFSLFPMINSFVDLRPIKDVSCSFAYGDHLFLGTREGVLLLYMIADAAQLGTKQPIRKWQLADKDTPSDFASIICIDIVEKPSQHLLFAATKQKLFCLKINHTRATHDDTSEPSADSTIK